MRYVRRPALLRYLSVLVLYFLALASKAMVVTFPFVLLLLDFWPLRRISSLSDEPDGTLRTFSLSRLVLEKIPLFFLAGAGSVLAYLAQHQSGSVVSSYSLPLAIRLSNAVVSYGEYLLKTLFPVNLAAIYPFRETFSAPGFLAALGALIAITWFVLRNFRSRPYLAVAWAWYLGTLVPVIGLVQVGLQAILFQLESPPLGIKGNDTVNDTFLVEMLDLQPFDDEVAVLSDKGGG